MLIFSIDGLTDVLTVLFSKFALCALFFLMSLGTLGKKRKKK